MIWQGAPAPGMRFSPQDLFVIPFAIFWLALIFVIFGTIVAGEAKNVDPMAYAILPLFLLIGIYMLVGRFLVDMFLRRHTRYMLTNGRAIIESGMFRSTTRSVNLAATSEIKYRESRNGRGSIQFGSAGMFAMIPPNWPGASQFTPPAFDGIEDARRVYQLVLSAQREVQTAR